MKNHYLQILSKLCSLSLLVFCTGLNANNLQDHPSPYLALHANDPVEWQAWGPHILQQAKDENKLIYLSIGYFSCHWCHVMQQESYKDKEVGELLNRDFIPVKVDRELRPALDRRMIRFVEAVRGQAGWPLNVFISPSGYPITGFTYLPRDDFYNVLGQLQNQWVNRDDELETVARDYFEQTENKQERSTHIAIADEHFPQLVDAFVAQAMLIADELQGGFGSTTKFPSYPQLNALLAVVRENPEIDKDVVDFLKLTLDTMATKHLMDHVNGGFFRYVTDPDWETPHFEKMLYDNAHLAKIYFDAETIWPDRGYAEIGLRTIEFMFNDLHDANGGFNASLSAVDTDNVEGGAYFWSMEQIKSALDTQQFSAFKKHWNLPEDESQTFQLNPIVSLGSPQLDSALKTEILEKLRQAERKVMPLDNKKLASWNALALKALIKAEKVDEGSRFQARTDRLFKFMQKAFIREGKVVRFAGHSQAAETTLTDYAQLASAFQAYAQARDDKKLEQQVDAIVEQALTLFFQNEHWKQTADSLIPGDNGDWVVQDSVLESPVSVLLETILKSDSSSEELKQQATTLMNRLTSDVLDVPYHYGSVIMLRNRYQALNGIKQVEKKPDTP